MESDFRVAARSLAAGSDRGRATGHWKLDARTRSPGNRILQSLDDVQRKPATSRLACVRLVGGAAAQAKEMGLAVGSGAGGNLRRAVADSRARLMAFISNLCRADFSHRSTLAHADRDRRVRASPYIGRLFYSASEEKRWLL